MTDMDESQWKNFEDIDNSQWWENYQELEYAWELQAGIYDPPVW